MLGNRVERGGAKDLLSTPDIPRSGGSQSCHPSDPRRSSPTRRHERGLGSPTTTTSSHTVAPLLAKLRRARAGKRPRLDVLCLMSGVRKFAIEQNIRSNGFQAACALSHNQGPKLDIRSNGLRGRLRLSPTKESA